MTVVQLLILLIVILAVLLAGAIYTLKLSIQDTHKAEELLHYWYTAVWDAHKINQHVAVDLEKLNQQPWRMQQVGEAFNETRLYLFPPKPPPKPILKERA